MRNGFVMLLVVICGYSAALLSWFTSLCILCVCVCACGLCEGEKKRVGGGGGLGWEGG